MIVKKIDIENYKGFEKQEITFNDNLNVFIGANASGKTSLLEVILKCLYDLVIEVNPDLKEVDRRLRLNHSEINYKEKYLRIICDIQPNDYPLLSVNLFLGQMLISGGSNREKQNQLIDDFKKTLTQPQTIPIIRYYPSEKNKIRNQTLSKKTPLMYTVGQLETWDNIIQDYDFAYTEFVQWFYNYETLELRLRRDKDDNSVEVPQLKYIRDAVQKALYGIYGKKYLIKSNGEIAVGHFKLTPKLTIKSLNGTTDLEEDLTAKSDGEKAIITLVADIAYNLALAHDFESDENYLNSPGIVLIDEIEEHLHPNWQRKIIPILTSVFPKIQFFITTHSPQVISSVNSEHVFLCEDFVVEKVHLRTKGVDSNALLTFLFNATERPKEYIDLINEFDELVENEADTSELEHIIEKVSELEEEDTGSNISGLVSDLRIQLSAYKFDLEHEMD